jgi:hypothetical protein
MTSLELSQPAPQPLSHNADLESAVHLALAGSPARVLHLDHGGEHYVIKRVRGKGRSRLKTGFVRFLCRVFFPSLGVRGRFAPRDGDFEAERIHALAAAGMRVAGIALALPEATVYTHCGTPLPEHMAGLAPAQRRDLLHRAVADLAEFHRAGCWHGGAQLRNLLLRDGRFYRVDFEEDLEDSMSLPLAQLYDLGQFLADVTCLRDMDVTPVELGTALLADYRRRHWSPDHQRGVEAVQGLARLVLFLGPWLERLDHRDGNRALTVARVLRSASDPAPSSS